MTYTFFNVMPNKVSNLDKNVRNIVLLSIFLSFVFQFSAFGQKTEEIPDFYIPQANLNLIEEYLESQSDENTIDFIEIVENLEAIYLNKYDINSVSKEDLSDLNLLSDIQVNNFFIYRDNYGPFIEIYELQAIPSFTLDDIFRISLFLTLDQSSENSSTIANTSNFKHEILWRTQRNLESLAGSTRENNPFLGDPYRHVFRYRLSDNQNFRLGVIAEKDVGESFFTQNNKAGFDFYSAFVSLKNINRTVQYLILGDYNVSMGQGLILNNKFGQGLSSYTINIKRNNKHLNHFNSRNEVNFFRGAATELRLNDNFTSTLFASQNKVNGTIRESTTDGFFEAFSTIDQSGNHRTQTEVDKKNQIKRTTAGGIVSYKKGNGRISANVLYDHFDKPFERTIRPDNIFFPRQISYVNASLDYSYVFKNFNIFGESAYSGNGATAHTAGLLIPMDSKLDLSILYRNHPADFTSLTPNAIGQSNNANNEEGIYFGLELRPSARIKINAYADTWTNPWLRFQTDAPGKGSEYLLKVSYEKRRKVKAYILIKTESKPRNSRVDAPIDYIVPQRTSKARIHVSHQLNSSWELRNRFEYSLFDNDLLNAKGYVFYQDVNYRSINSPISFTTRVMWFDIEEFNARIYTYESDVLSDFYVPFFSGQGIRYYLNLRYRLRNATLEIRWAQTRYTDGRENISSGVTEIEGNVSTNVKFQAIKKF